MNQNNGKWFNQKEKSRSGLGYFMMLFVLKCFPSLFMRFLAYIIGFFYWIFSAKDRNFSKTFLTAAYSAGADFNKKRPSTLKHFISFALNVVENLQGWAKKFSFKNVSWQNDDVYNLVEKINSGEGAILLVSHLGNAQMMKALASMNEAGTRRKIDITSVMDIKMTGGFTKLLEHVNPDSTFHVISSDSIGPDTIFILEERLKNGELVVIAGDRIGSHSDRFIEFDFLGRKAKFPYGVYLMISLLNAPTYFVFGMRHSDLTLNPSYDMYVKKNDVTFDCTRKERENRIIKTAQNFIEELTVRVKEHPYQWYNFFDFWE